IAKRILKNMALNFLVVDDSPLQRQFAAAVCRELGASDVHEAGNGQEALDVLASLSRSPDVILCDLEMPGMDGVVLIQELARRSVSARVVVVSSRETGLLNTVEIMAEAAGMPVLGVLQKPVSQDALSEVLAKLRTPAPSRHTESVSIQIDEKALLQAIRNKEFVNFYQPKVNIKTGDVKGVECLVRWQHPELGLVLPGHFIPLAESSGLIENITDLVIDNALEDCHRWRGQGLNLTVAVNLSARSLVDPMLADKLATRVEQQGLSACDIMLEITETAAMEDVSNTLGTLARLRLKGFGLSIDDYGTGQSSLQRIKTMPFTELKIDRSFVHRAHKIKASRVLLEHAVAMGRELKLITVAEGVETQEDLALLDQLGCDIAQGYLISRPLSASAFLDWMAAH
ncbi:MAG TPA: EAL domain-containing response regulator, partial [Pseudomonadales bacterium]|nr:EAL domain-containing response regulator [Pseudomonadales bacterium]